MTEMSAVRDDPDFDGINILAEKREKECCFGETVQTLFESVFLSGLEKIEVANEEKIIVFISNMGNSVIPYSIAVGEKKHILVIWPL